MLTQYLIIFVGGGLGSVFRMLVSGSIARHFGESFPLGTLVVNISGSFLIGLIATLTDTDGRFFLGPLARQFLMIGILGGYTTFSSFSLQTLNLARDGEWLYAAVNASLSLAFCLVGAWLGHLAAMSVNHLR